MRGCRILITGLLALMLWPGIGIVACPTEPAGSWVYSYLYEVRLREAPERLFVSTGPYRRIETAAWLGNLSPVEPGTRGAWLYRMLQTEFKDETGVLGTGSGWAGDLRFGGWAESDTRVKGETLGRVAYYSPLGICFWTSVRASVNAPDLHKVETNTWSDRARASVDYAGVAFRRNGFGVALARDLTSWGASRLNGLLLSGAAPACDMFSISYHTQRVGFMSIHTQLRRGDDDAWDDDVRRFVAAHRIEVLPTDRISLSLSEAVIYGGPGRTFEPEYLNPLLIFYAGQWNSERNDNIFIAGDFSLLFPGIAEVRGEVMVDDFQYEVGNEPHEVAAALYVAAVNPVLPRNSLVGASYCHVRNQTYGHFVAWNRFVHEGRVMGYPDGPDGDRMDLWLTLASPEAVTWKAGYSLRRKGEGRATDVQEKQGPRVKFPSGTVEIEHGAGIEFAWRPSHAWMLTGRAGYHLTQNSEHREGVDESGWDLSLSAGYYLKWKDLVGELRS
jgi:hypothetical protein